MAAERAVPLMPRAPVSLSAGRALADGIKVGFLREAGTLSEALAPGRRTS